MDVKSQLEKVKTGAAQVKEDADVLLEKFDVEFVGQALHTALRKCCDSTPTTIAWNLISMDQFTGVWEDYLALIKKEPSTLRWPVRLEFAAQKIESGRYSFNALKATFKLFSAGDWRDMASFLETEEKR